MSDININYAEEMFKEYSDVINAKQLKLMLGNTIGNNKIYELLKSKEIYNKKIGNKYFIPKICVIEYLMKN